MKRISEQPHTVYVGYRHVWGGEKLFGLSGDDRRRHTYVIGQTGVGKTTLLRNLILQDVYAGAGVTVLDPHGDLVEDLLDHIPRRRIEDVVYFSPADYDYPVAFNLLRAAPEEARPLIASAIVGCFKSLWRDSWGPRLESLLFTTIVALLDCQNASILGLPRMLTDDHYRAWAVRQCKDPVVRTFWENEFAAYESRFRSEVTAPVLNKVNQLLFSAKIRNCLGQVRNKINMRLMMDNRRILIANLSKGRLGEDKSNLLGAVLVTQLQFAAMGRVDVPEPGRVDHVAYIDEFGSFSTDSFAAILSESRKYRLSLVLSHQYTAQLRDEVRDAIFGNVGNLIAFRIGEDDARVLARQFGDYYPPNRFTELRNHAVCCKLLVDGEHTDPFLARTLPPLFERCGHRDKIVRRSRDKYATPRAVAEERIERWMNGKA